MVSAASGTGKTSLIKALLACHPDLHLSISHTTRPMRSGETNGVNYHFVDRKTFLAMRRDNAFVESAEVFGNLYGTSIDALEQCRLAGQDAMLEIDWQGAVQVRTRLGEVVSIFIMPPSFAHLRQRLEQRKMDAAEVIQQRLAEASVEIAQYADFNYLVVNQDFDEALDKLSAIVKAERSRMPQAEQRLASLLASLKTTPQSD